MDAELPKRAIYRHMAGSLTTEEIPLLVAMKPLLPSASQWAIAPCGRETERGFRSFRLS